MLNEFDELAVGPVARVGDGNFSPGIRYLIILA
jgi:hypothetical protein